MAAFLGLRGTGDWVTDERPKNWRAGILELFPNGTAPLTALTSKMSSRKVDDPEFNWWTRTLTTQRAAVTGIYTDAGLSSAAGDASSAGDIVYATMTAANVAQFRPGHQVIFRDASKLDVDVTGKVLTAVTNGASSYISVKLLEADDNSTNGLSDVDTVIIIGNVNPEGGEIPESLIYDPTKVYNYTQIFRTSLDLTRTAMQTRLRSRDAYMDAKKQALQLHGMEMEKAFLFGERNEGTGSNGKPERTTRGLANWILDAASANIKDYDVDYNAATWATSGKTWLEDAFELFFRYGSGEKLALCGSGALLGINRIADTFGQINLSPNAKTWGIAVNEWITPFGRIYLMTHPLFTQETTWRNSMILLEPKNIIYAYIQDTKFKRDTGMNEAGQGAIDGKTEEFLTEAGLEVHYPETMGILKNVGVDGSGA